VEVVAGGRSQFRFAKGGGSYASSPDRRLVVGLGTGDKIDRVTVRWPDGKEENFSSARIDRYQKLVQGSGKAE